MWLAPNDHEALGQTENALAVDLAATIRPLDGLELGASVGWNDLTWDADTFQGLANTLTFVEGERTTRPVDGITARSDMLMLILTSGGQERTTEELAALARQAGLAHERSIRLASADRAHVFRPLAEGSSP